MVNILSNIIQIIMLATSSNTFLGVDSSYPLGHITIGVNSTQENGLKLHHKNSKINTFFCDTSKIFRPIKPSLTHWNFNNANLFSILQHILILSW
jgi:hypothetical protein